MPNAATRAGAELPRWLPLVVSALALGLIAIGSWKLLAPRTCADHPEVHDQDECYAAELVRVPSGDTTRVAKLAGEIHDPLISGAAIVAWAEANRGRLAPVVATEICPLAGGLEGKCRYQVQAGHLDVEHR